MTEGWSVPQRLAEAIRGQRELAELPMRQLAAMVGISNPYLSQIENGLREPSERVLEDLDPFMGSAQLRGLTGTPTRGIAGVVALADLEQLRTQVSEMLKSLCDLA